MWNNFKKFVLKRSILLHINIGITIVFYTNHAIEVNLNLLGAFKKGFLDLV